MKTLLTIAFVLFAGSAYAQPAAPSKSPAPTEKKAPEKAPPKTDTPPKAAEVSAPEAEKFLAFYNKFVDVIVAGKEDCAKLTKDINVLIDANGDLIKKIQEAKSAKKELPADTKSKMMARVKEMMPAMQKCNTDANFMTAMKRMESNKSAAATQPAKEPAKTTPPPAKEPAKTTVKAPATKTETKTEPKPATTK